MARTFGLGTLAPVALLAFALAPRAQERAHAPDDASPKPRVLGVDVTFLANAGFFLESGRYSVLIDSFVREPTDPYGALPAEVHKQLVAAEPPFDGLTIVLVSHLHPDHVQMRGLEKYLANNKQAQLMTAPVVLKALKDAARDPDAIQRRLTPIRTVTGSVTQLAEAEMSIEVFELDHAGKSGEGVLNLAHLVDIGGVRVLHVGDAEPTVENLRRYDLASRAIDVALLPYWFLQTPERAQLIQQEIRPRVVVICHVPPRQREQLGALLTAHFPDFVLCGDALEKRHFDPVPAAASSEGHGD